MPLAASRSTSQSASASTPIPPSPVQTLQGFSPISRISSSLRSPTRSVPSSPASPQVATFTAGVQHSPTLGPLKIESTTGSGVTALKDRRKKKHRNGSSIHSYGSGISSEDIFGKPPSTAESRQEPSGSGSLNIGLLGRRLSMTSTKSKKSVDHSSKAGSLLPMTAGEMSPAFDGGIGRQRDLTTRLEENGKTSSHPSSSRHSARSRSSTSFRSDASSLNSKASEGSKRNGRSSRNFARRKDSSERREEEEQLRVLADLRLKALAMASAEGTPVDSVERMNAEALVQQMSRSASQSSSYSQHSGLGITNDKREPVLHITAKRGVEAGVAALSSQSEDSAYSSQSEEEDTVFPRVSSWQKEVDEAKHSGEGLLDDAEDAHLRASVSADSRRRSTIVPFSPPPPSEVHTRHPSESSGPQPHRSSGVKRSSGLWHIRDSLDGKTLPAAEQFDDDGLDADFEGEEDDVTSKVLERRRSTLRAGQTASWGNDPAHSAG